MSRPFVEAWTAVGTPEQCIAQLRGYFDAGVEEITVRLACVEPARTAGRFLGEVAPAFAPDRPGKPA